MKGTRTIRGWGVRHSRNQGREVDASASAGEPAPFPPVRRTPLHHSDDLTDAYLAVHPSGIVVPSTSLPLLSPSHAPPPGAFTAPTSTKHTSTARKAKAKDRSRAKKKQKREDISAAQRERLPSPAVVTVDLPAETLKDRAAHGNFVGRGGECGEAIPNLHEALAKGQVRIKWDGL